MQKKQGMWKSFNDVKRQEKRLKSQTKRRFKKENAGMDKRQQIKRQSSEKQSNEYKTEQKIKNKTVKNK